MSITNPARRGWLALVAALALVLTTACSDDPEQADTESLSNTGTEEQAPVEEEAPVETAAAAATEPAEGAAQSEAAPAEPSGPPLASMTMPITFIEGGELEADVISMDVTGELMRVGITFTASLPVEVEEVGIGAVLTANENAPAAGISPEVIDPVNLKAYQAVAGWIPNGTSIYLRDGASHTIVFYYAAPQEQVETVDIKLSSQTPPITDVPFPS
jgi:hypothetical protein